MGAPTVQAPHHGEQDGGLREAHAGGQVAGEEGGGQARQEVQDQVVVHQVVAVRLRAGQLPGCLCVSEPCAPGSHKVGEPRDSSS